MKKITTLLTLVVLLIGNTAHAQFLATEEMAEKAKKVIMKCSGYWDGGIATGNFVETPCDIELSRIDKENMTVKVYANDQIETSFDMGMKENRKRVNDATITHSVDIFNQENPTADSPSIHYQAETDNTGCLKSAIQIEQSGRKRTYLIYHSIFTDKDGTYAFYLDRVHAMNNDLNFVFMKSIKCKNAKKEGDDGGGFFSKFKKKFKKKKQQTEND